MNAKKTAYYSPFDFLTPHLEDGHSVFIGAVTPSAVSSVFLLVRSMVLTLFLEGTSRVICFVASHQLHFHLPDKKSITTTPTHCVNLIMKKSRNRTVQIETPLLEL